MRTTTTKMTMRTERRDPRLQADLALMRVRVRGWWLGEEVVVDLVVAVRVAVEARGAAGCLPEVAHDLKALLVISM